MSLSASGTSSAEGLKTGVFGWRRQRIQILRYTLVLIGVTLTVGAYHHFKPFPKGLNYASAVHGAIGAQLLFDVTQGTNHEQRIFDEVFKHIDQAEKYILMDMKRNLGNLNLETDVKITCGPSGLMDDFKAYYERIWNLGQEYEAQKDESRLKYWTCRFQEATGMCTF